MTGGCVRRVVRPGRLAKCMIVAVGNVEKCRHKVAELPNHIAQSEANITHKDRNETVLLNNKNS